MNPYRQDETFEKTDYRSSGFAKGEYEQCTFRHCSFMSVDLSGVKFMECVFEDCNFSLASFKNTALQEVNFKSCKLLGIRFDECTSFLLAFRFEHCILDHASFFGVKIKKTVFDHCSLKEADFTQADLSGSSFDHCDLKDTRFDRTLLEKCDFRNALHYVIDPENNKLKKAKFALHGLPGLLAKYDLVVEQ